MIGTPAFDSKHLTRAQLQELVRSAWAQHARLQDDLTDRLSNAHADLAHALGSPRDPESPVVKFGNEASIQPRDEALSLTAAAAQAMALIADAFSLALTSEDWLHEAVRASSALNDTRKEGNPK